MLLQPLKAYDPMVVTALQADKSTLGILVHSEKAYEPMDVSLVHPERLRLFMPLHPLKASSAIVVSSVHSERLSPGKLLQFMKARPSINRSEDGQPILIFDKLVHPLKAAHFMSLIVPLSVISCNDVQSTKTVELIVSRDVLPKSAFLIFVQLQKAHSPIFVMELGRMTLVMLLQP